MDSSLDFVEFVCSQLKELGIVRYRKMFGEYMVYVNEKPAVLVCDNMAYIKKHPAITDLMQEAETGTPYNGAKEHYLLDVEHKADLLKVVGTLEKVLPYPPNRKPQHQKHDLRAIPNVGVQTEQDLIDMGYTSQKSLKGKKANDLYREECLLRGYTVDRCQLYLYRALEYFINTENPDTGKCKWWHWKDDFFYPSPCGARCVECASFPKNCKGCRNIKGNVFWLKYTVHDVCPIWKCCEERNRQNCGGCPELPCSRFMKDPSLSDEENETHLKKMLENITEQRHTAKECMETERLILRPWTESDAEALYKYAQHPAIGPIAGWPPHTSVENSREVIKTILSTPETYAVVLKENNEPIGSVGIMFEKDVHSADIKEGDAEIGYWIGTPYWGQGLIPEAVKRLLMRCFNELDIKRVWCGYYDGNTRSRRVMDKCGFKFHHTEEGKTSPLGDVRTEHFTLLTKEDWEKMKFHMQQTLFKA